MNGTIEHHYHSYREYAYHAGGIILVGLLLGFVALQGGDIPGIEIPNGGSFAPAFQNAPFGSADSSTVMYCHFNTNTNCLKFGGSISPKKSTYTVSNPGVFGTKSANIPASGAVGIYPSNNFTMQVGTIEAWVNPNSSTTRNQFLFSADGGKSLDGDKYNDYVFGETGFDPVPNVSKIFFGTGTGIDTNNPLTFPSFVVRGLVTGDVDGDLDMDMVVSNTSANEIWIFKGPFAPGQALPDPAPSERIAVPSPQGNSIADLDGDGDLDLLVSSYHAATAPVYGFENDGAGNFTPLTFNFGPLVEPAEGMDVADFDQDGLLDVVFGSFSPSPYQPSLLFYGQLDGMGNYTLDLADPANYQVLDSNILGITTGDVDNDGWIDVIQADVPNDRVIIRKNDRTGHFPNVAPYRIVISTPDPFTVTTADIDNDGHLDIGVANYRPNGTTNNTTSKFYRGPSFTTTKSYNVNNAVSLSVGDLDGDGLNDLGYHSSTGTNCPLYYLNVAGNLKSTVNITCQSSWGSSNGPGSAVHAASSGSSPYGRNATRYNDMDLYFNPGDGAMHFEVWDTHGVLYEVTASFTRNGTMQKVQAEWDFSAGRMRLIIGNPSAGGSDTLVTSPQAIPYEHAPMVIQIGTNHRNQYSLNGRMDELRISNIERGV